MPRVTGLTPKQERFVEEYLVDLCAAAAARRAGYSARRADAIGGENLRKPAIAAAIAARRAQLQASTEITQERVLRELAKVAFLDSRRFFDADGRPVPLHQLDAETAGAVVGLDVLEEFAGIGPEREKVGEVKKYKLADKVKALELLGRHLGTFDDRVKVDLGRAVTVYIPGNGRNEGK